MLFENIFFQSVAYPFTFALYFYSYYLASFILSINIYKESTVCQTPLQILKTQKETQQTQTPVFRDLPCSTLFDRQWKTLN